MTPKDPTKLDHYLFDHGFRGLSARIEWYFTETPPEIARVLYQLEQALEEYGNNSEPLKDLRENYELLLK